MFKIINVEDDLIMIMLRASWASYSYLKWSRYWNTQSPVMIKIADNVNVEDDVIMTMFRATLQLLIMTPVLLYSQVLW